MCTIAVTTCSASGTWNAFILVGIKIIVRRITFDVDFGP